VLIGAMALLVYVIWWFVDLFTLHKQTEAENEAIERTLLHQIKTKGPAGESEPWEEIPEQAEPSILRAMGIALLIFLSFVSIIYLALRKNDEQIQNPAAATFQRTDSAQDYAAEKKPALADVSPESKAEPPAPIAEVPTSTIPAAPTIAPTTSPASRSRVAISLINGEGSTFSCPAGAEDCVTDTERRGFVKLSDAVAGITVDWKARPLKIVEVRGTAADAGVRNGDIVLEIDGNKIAEPLSIFIIMGTKQPGDQLQVKVMRAGTPMDFAYKAMQR
jgi:hypothetical protein